jgi:hypothetical protein
MAVVTLKNIENAAGGLLTNEVSAASTVTTGGSVPTVAVAMLAVALAAAIMWLAYHSLQSVSTTPVNSFLDLAITGLTIGAGTKPLHDLITSMQVKASSAA